MNNLWIASKNTPPFKVSTENCEDVFDLIKAVQKLPNSPRAAVFTSDIILKLPEGFERSCLPDPDCFSSKDENDTTLGMGVSLLLLNGLGTDYRKPLLIVNSQSKPIRTQTTIERKITNEGVPGQFLTLRKRTIADFCNLLFPPTGSLFTSVIFIRSPPYSGKTGLAQLLSQKLCENKERSVLLLTGLEIGKKKFKSYFSEVFGLDLLTFLKKTDERVIIIDEAQCTYEDNELWSVVKNTLGLGYNNLRFVLLSSYGSFNSYDICKQTPINIPPDNLFGLYSISGKPSLQLKFEEFQEMVSESNFKFVEDILWEFCSQHIGVAYTILEHLSKKFRALNPSVTDVALELWNNSLLLVMSKQRGVPSLNNFNLVAKSYNFDKGDGSRAKNLLDSIAECKINERNLSPGSLNVLSVLLEFGFLFYNDHDNLQFASEMHRKVWLYSIRKDIAPVNSLTFDTILQMAIGRMSAKRLAEFRSQNNERGVRERQFQMELYSSMVSLLPRNVTLIPEWKTDHGNGYVDLVLLLENKIWFIELLFDGIAANEHFQRFSPGGKYYESLVPNSGYVLVDFRDSVKAKFMKTEFTYVSFSESYSFATYKKAGCVEVTIILKSE